MLVFLALWFIFIPLDIQKSETAHSLRPMTIYQLIQASQAHTDADWVLDDQEIGQVKKPSYLDM